MLEEVRIRDLGVIEDAVLVLSPGLTVLTGETGAGKTMVVTALGLLLGARGDAGAVRAGATRTHVEGTVLVSGEGADLSAAALERIADAGAEIEDDRLIISRTIPVEGRSRAHLGGRSVPVSVLSDVADDLVAVHGQSDQHRLLRTSRQREALDRYAGAELAGVADDYRRTWARVQAARAELRERREQAAARAQEAELLRVGLAHVEALEPMPGEDHALRSEESRLAHAETLRLAAEAAHASLAGPLDDAPGGSDASDATTLVDRARRAVDAARHHDEQLGGLADRLAEAGYLLADIAADLAGYASGVEIDPARLAGVQDRRAALSALTRVHGPDVDAALAWSQAAAGRLLELDDDGAAVERLADELRALHARLGESATRLHRLRSAAAHRLGGAVTDELRALAMARAVVDVRVTLARAHAPDATAGRTPGERDPDGEARTPSATGEVVLDIDGSPATAGPYGVDEVEFLLAANPGAPARPLARSASGGELSRVMLALEVVLAHSDPVPTFVFDEVDAGVGGAAATEVGRRLARLARTAQVIVVTHLAQVAAFADTHLAVVKDSDGSVTSSGVTALDDDSRLAELSRMLGGRADSDVARAHARELRDASRSGVH